MLQLRLTMFGFVTLGKPSMCFIRQSYLFMMHWLIDFHRDIDEHDRLAEQNPII